jgi:hypothetical protein
MTTASIGIIKKLEGFLQDCENILHKPLVYIFYNTKHQERRRRNHKQGGNTMGLRYARINHY